MIPNSPTVTYMYDWYPFLFCFGEFLIPPIDYKYTTYVADSRGEGKQQKQLMVTVKSFIQ